MRIRLRTLAVLVLLASCSDSASPPGLPAELQLVTGGASINAHVGDTLAPIVVRVRDANGRAVPNVPVVAWGTVGPVPAGRTDYGVTPLDSVVFTDQAGRASIRMVAPTVAGSGTITVQIGNVPMEQSTATTLPTGATIPIVATAGSFAKFVTHSMKRFAGATFPIDSLFTAADKYGNPVNGPGATVTATNGWTVSGNTLTPPSASYVGTTVATATSGSATATDSVSVIDDFRKYHWNLSWACASTPAQIAAGDPDSVVAVGTNGVAIYPTDPGFAPIMGHAGVGAIFVAVEFKFTGTLTSYRNGVAAGTTDIMAGEPYNWDVMSQTPDALVFGVDTYARTLVRVPGPLPTFVSPTAWCSGTTLHPVTLQTY